MALRADIASGADILTDQSAYWEAFRDALADISDAGGRPHGIIPQCDIYTSTAPNFAIKWLTLETQGLPKIISTSTQPGFKCDATGLGVGGVGLFRLEIGALMAGTTTGAIGIDIRCVHHSIFNDLVSLGATEIGYSVLFCVCSVFNNPRITTADTTLLATPSVGLNVNGLDANTSSGWSTFNNPVCEWVETGILLDRVHGIVINGGTSESCDTGLRMTANAAHCTIVGTDIEANAVAGVNCEGYWNTFVGVQCTDLFQLASPASGNLISGGVIHSVSCSAGTSFNNFHGCILVTDSIADGGASNNFRDCKAHWAEAWYVPAPKSYTPTVINSAGGPIVSYTAVGEYSVRAGVVQISVSVTIVDKGVLPSGYLQVSLPFVANGQNILSGAEMGHSVRGCYGYIDSGDDFMQVRYSSDGGYPGDVNGNVVVITGSYQMVPS